MVRRTDRGRTASARTFRADGAKATRIESGHHRRSGRLLRPCYDGERGELRVDGVVVKRFTQKSDAQAVILAAFEEEGWTWAIDDPLAGKHGQHPKQRLQNAVRNLNRRQRQLLLRFRLIRQGTGVAWEYRAEARNGSDT